MFNKKRFVFISVLLALIFWECCVLPAWAGVSNSKLLNEEVITRGALLQRYQVDTGKGKAAVYVTKMNLKDSLLKVDTIFGSNSKLGTNQTIGKMADENKAIAAINGDFFDMAGGTPLGPLVSNDQWITTPANIDGMSVFAFTASREPIITSFSFKGSVSAQNGKSFAVSSLNKTISMADKINVYDSYWNMNNWPTKNLDSYIAVVVEDNIVKEVLENNKPGQISPNAWVIIGNGKGAQFIKENIQINDSIKLDYTIQPDSDWSTVLGGHTVLVDNGKRVSFSKNIAGYHARTALGYSQDKDYLYWVTVEKSNNSSGMTLEELADFMISIGVNKGLNLDGGGSTTLVSRHPGETFLSLINTPQQENQRAVPNGLALFSTAPQGKFKDIVYINVPSLILINESFPIKTKAVDEYDNPFLGTVENVLWTAANQFVAVQGDRVTGIKPGTGLIKASIGNQEKKFSVEVAGRDKIQYVSLGVPSLLFNSNEESITITPKVTFKNGQAREVSADLFKWEWIGIKGSVENGTARVINAETGSGWLVGKYDGFSFMVPVQVGSLNQSLESFENRPLLKFTGIPQGTKGEFILYNGDQKDGLYSGKLSYEFSDVIDDLQIAYGQFGDGGIVMPGTANGINLWVYGDNSGLWLRAEIVDSQGKTQYLTLADKVDWTGWKKVSGDFPNTLQSPKLKRVYLVKNKDTGSNVLTKGSILIDQIEFVTSQPVLSKIITIKMYSGKKVMTVNGKEQAIDQGPLIEKQRSYIPARFLVEAMGGEVFWYAQEKQVRILMANNMIDLWVNDKEHVIVNGINKPSDTAPIIRNGRTLIPVRMVSENLGYIVDWNKGEITIRNK
jgi:exopolysaccharide biosynthesis protein